MNEEEKQIIRDSCCITDEQRKEWNKKIAKTITKNVMFLFVFSFSDIFSPPLKANFNLSFRDIYDFLRTVGGYKT